MQVYFMKMGKREYLQEMILVMPIFFFGGIKLLAETINLSKSQVGEIGRAKTLVRDAAQAYKILPFYPMTKRHYVTIKLADCYGRLTNLYS